MTDSDDIELAGAKTMNLSRRTRVGIGAAAAGALVVGAAMAQVAGSGLPVAVQRLLACRAATPDSARLACYDTAVGEFARLVDTGELVVVDKERVSRVKRQAFGFSLPSLSLFEHGDKPAELDSISAVAASAYRQGDGRWVVELEDGGVWAQTDNEAVGHDPRKGSMVEIKKAAMGSFFMKIDGQRALRARRVK